MKRNKPMRLASGLLVLTLATTCVISGTFAKYVTSQSGTDSARVAKWGFTDTTNSQITLTNLFATSYDQNVEGKADVIAPGTTNSAEFKFAYDTTSNSVTAPEVAYTFNVSTEDSSCADDIKNNKNIVWSLDNEVCTATDDKTSWDVLIGKIKALSGDESGSKQYEAGQLPAAFYGSDTVDGSKSHTVSWQWKFDEGNNDATDTAMGNKATLDTVKLNIKITATQVD